MEKEVAAALIQGLGTIAGAIIVGVAGVLIGNKYARERDRQDKESQWRSHAVELTKLDLERKIHTRKEASSMRPSILDFLANYRDLKELDKESPGDLYEIILDKRIKKKVANQDEEDS